MGIDGKQLLSSSVADGKLAEQYINSDGTRAMAANLAMGSFKITGLQDGTGSNDAVTKSQLDSAVTGLQWRAAVSANLLGNVQVTGLVGSAAETVIEGVTPASGDAYVVSATDGDSNIAGDVAVAVGDIVQYDGANWFLCLAHSSNLPPAAAYALMHDTETLVGTGFSGYSNGDLVDFDGATLYGSSSSPSAGHAYVVGDNGSVTCADLDEGDLLEYSGTAWVVLVTNSGGFVPDGTRAITGLTPPYVLIAPYVDSTDDGEIVSFDGASNTGTDTGDATDSASLLFQDPNHVGVYDNVGYVFEGTTPTGSWIQFTGAGQINAGAGLDKSANTIFVGDVNRGVQVNADDLEIDGSEIASSGLEQDATNSWQIRIASSAAGNGLSGGSGSALAVQPNTTDGGGVAGLEVAANGVRISTSAAGNGLQGGGGAALSVLPNTTDGGGVAGLETAANGVRIATSAAGNGLTGGGGAALSVQPNTTDGGGVPGLEVAANGIRLSTGAAGNGLTGGGGAALAVLAANTSIDVSGSGVLSSVPSSSNKDMTASVTSVDGDQATSTTMAAALAAGSYPVILVNGVQESVGSGVKTEVFYFSNDSGTTARTFANVASGDTLHFNGTIAGYELAASDRLDVLYEAAV